jgi:hypothetical protein
MAATARKVLMALAWLYVLGIALQFLFAGLGLLGGETFELHEAFGYAALHFTPILLIIAAAVGRVGTTLLVLTIVLTVVSIIQPFWVTEFRDEFLGSFHVLGALVLFALAHAVAQRATALVKTEA